MEECISAGRHGASDAPLSLMQLFIHMNQLSSIRPSSKRSQGDTMPTVIKIPVEGPATIETVNGYEDMQAIVGGLFSHGGHKPDDYDLSLYANDEGRFMGFDRNIAASKIYQGVGGDIIVGDAFLTRTDPENGETIDITEADKEWFTEVTGRTIE